jgi:hypothetical protein
MAMRGSPIQRLIMPRLRVGVDKAIELEQRADIFSTVLSECVKDLLIDRLTLLDACCSLIIVLLAISQRRLADIRAIVPEHGELCRIHCGYCKHDWAIRGELPMNVKQFCALVDEAVEKGCEKCGSRGDAIKCGAWPPVRDRKP